MKSWVWTVVLLGAALGQRCPEPVYVVTNAELRWGAGGNMRSIAAGKTAAACEGDTLEAVQNAQVSFGYAAGQPQRRSLKAGEKLVLQMPRSAPPVVKGLAATLGDNLKALAQRWFGGTTPRPVEAASRGGELAGRSVYLPLLVLGHNQVLAGATQLVLPYAEAAPPYTLTLSQGGQILAQTRSAIYDQVLVLRLGQPLAAGTYQLRLDSGNGSAALETLEAVEALPPVPPELAGSDPQAVYSTLWLAHQPGWALEALQRAYRWQTDYPVLGLLVTLMTPRTPEEERLMADNLGG